MASATCAFCQIVAAESPAAIVYASDSVVCFLDIRPLFPGHLLVVPRAHHRTLSDLPAEELQSFFAAVQLMVRAIETAMGAEGTFVAMNNTVSQSVPHLHCHVVPRSKGDGLRGFFWPRNLYRDAEHLLEVRDRIIRAVAEIGEGG